jgi:hypothetical protein
MNQEVMANQFSKLGAFDQTAVLLQVTLRLTVVARDILRGPPDAKKLNQARGMSEINHKIISNVLARLRSADSRYPDDVLIGILYGIFSEYELESYLPYVWKDALTNLHGAVSPPAHNTN